MHSNPFPLPHPPPQLPTLSPAERALLPQLSFDDYMKIKRFNRRTALMVAVPGYFSGAFLVSAICVERLPALFPQTPEEVQLVM